MVNVGLKLRSPGARQIDHDFVSCNLVEEHVLAGRTHGELMRARLGSVKVGGRLNPERTYAVHSENIVRLHWCVFRVDHDRSILLDEKVGPVRNFGRRNLKECRTRIMLTIEHFLAM